MGLCAPFVGGRLDPISHNAAGAEAYLHAKFDLDPFNSLPTIHQRHGQTDRQTDRTGPTGQRSDSIGRTVLQTVVQKLQAV